jgi:hypothetical protein
MDSSSNTDKEKRKKERKKERKRKKKIARRVKKSSILTNQNEDVKPVLNSFGSWLQLVPKAIPQEMSLFYSNAILSTGPNIFLFARVIIHWLFLYH